MISHQLVVALSIEAVVASLVVAGFQIRHRRPGPSAPESGGPGRVSDEFRRPAEFGPLYLPADQVERLRVGILLDQITADEDSEWQHFVDLRDGRAGLMPWVPPSTTEERRERATFWLSHWDDAVLALTGRGLA